MSRFLVDMKPGKIKLPRNRDLIHIEAINELPIVVMASGTTWLKAGTIIVTPECGG